MKIGLILALFFSLSANAASILPQTLTAGKTTVPQILDDSSNDISSQYTISYSGSEIKVTKFAGKTILIGSTAGTFNLILTNNTDHSILTATITVSSGPAANIQILDGNTQTSVAGSTLNPLRVKVVDSFGNTVSGFPVSFSVSKGSATLGSAISNSDASGIASSTLTLGSVAEVNLINATATINGFTKQVQFGEYSTAAPGTASKFAILSSPASANIGSPMGSIGVSVVDSSGTLSMSFSGQVSVSGFMNSSCSIPSSQPLLGTLAKSTTLGMVTFSDLQAQTVEPLYLKISATGINPSCSKMVSILPASTGLASLKVPQWPLYLTTNKNLFPSVKVEELDNNGQVFSNNSNPITITSYDDVACTQPSKAQFTNNVETSVGGFSTFPNLQLSEAKTVYLRAESGSVKSDCSPPLVVGGITTACASGYVVSNNACISAIPVEVLLASKRSQSPSQMLYFMSSYNNHTQAQYSFNNLPSSSNIKVTRVKIGLAQQYLASDYSPGQIFANIYNRTSSSVIASSSNSINPTTFFVNMPRANAPYNAGTASQQKAAALAIEQMVEFDFATPISIPDLMNITIDLVNANTDNQIWGFNDIDVYGYSQ
jgi:hypothetical protein